MIESIQIVSYRGYATNNYLYCKGRLLENDEIASSTEDSVWRNIRNNYRRFESDEIPDARLKISCDDNDFEVTTDEEGYFTLQTPLQHPIPEGIEWQAIDINLLEVPAENQPQLSVKGEVIVPPTDAEFGVISDIDDTIMQTDVNSRLKLKMLYHTFAKNAYSRVAFEGVAAFYQALLQGSDCEQMNPLFYVSNSPWNLYDMLEDFMHINKIPKGPILLRDFGFSIEGDDNNFSGNKYERVKSILNVYKHLKFILIGDAGEKDADIYLQIARELPEQVAAIYIRAVGDAKRNQRIEELIAEEAQVPILLVKHTLEAATHAAENGFVHPDCLMEIQPTV